MSKNIRKILSFLLPALLLAGCSAIQKEYKAKEEVKNTTQDYEAYSDTSAPLPVDSAEVSEDYSESTLRDSLRHPQSRVPFDGQVKEQQMKPETSVDAPEEESSLTENMIKKPGKGSYTIQLGAFSTFENAAKFMASSENQLGKNLTAEFNTAKGLYVVRFGQFATKPDAEKTAKKLKNKNFKDVFIVKTK